MPASSSITKSKSSKSAKRSRRYAATFYQQPDFTFDTDKIKYFIAGEEVCPDTKRTHWQAYVEFKNRVSLKVAKSLLDDEKVHLESAGGNAVSNIKYCSKDGNIYREEGTKPSGQGKRSDLLAFRDHFKEKKTLTEAVESDEMLPMLARYPRLANTLSLMYSVERSQPTELYIFWGVTGSGKSHKAFEDGLALGPVYFKPSADRWWDGYDGQPTVIFEDFRGDIALAQLLRLADKYPMRVPVKGAYRQFTSKRIYITSNLDIDDWFNKEQKGYEVSMSALRRRITKKVHFGQPYVPPQ